MSAHADVFDPHFPVSELHSTQGAFQTGSYAASTMMGAQGFMNDPVVSGWDSIITSFCTASSGVTAWPSGCNPAGMAASAHHYSNDSWVTVSFLETDLAAALNLTVNSLQVHGSPAVVPIFGQADHWVAVTEIRAVSDGAGGWVVQQVKWLDGGPISGDPANPFVDSNFNAYTSGISAFSGTAWRNTYFKVLTGINPGCDPCTSDLYYNKYVIMYEPNVSLQVQPAITTFSNARGIVPAGTMTAALAQSQALRALSAGGVDTDPQIWGPISSGVPGPAYQVNGVYATGAPWNYFLVPIFGSVTVGTTDTRPVIGFAQLSTADGAFEAVNVLSTPLVFSPVSAAQAQQMASRLLAKGELLTGGGLTWDPRSGAQIARAPTRPYYEFGVFSGAVKVGAVQVPLYGGAAVRSR
jgi:hypothetical protein